ncbi:MAG: hypothetical protein A3H29_06120 [Acidobacteria bacterium RIFCSPLOWO2_02_FULL_67_21]|nr:MAG: hypothetical protein A3H29_06120 [Acidobacteria bacterium RIFCSPLOWO2_02_FULL_67_21]
MVLMGLAAVTLTALYSLWSIDRRSIQLTDHDEAIAARVDRLIDVIAAIGTIQQGYVAPGQLDEPAFERMTTLLQQLEAERSALGPLLRSPAAAGSLEALAESGRALAAADARTRENLSLGQELMASDVIFSDGRNLLDGMIAAIRDLHAAERRTSRGERVAVARWRWLPIGLILLVGLGAARRAAGISGAAVRSTPAVRSAAPDAGTRTRSAPPAPSVDLGAAAALCTDLARVTDTAALSQLLARAAAILDAAGLIVWMGAGEQLFAALGHGYGPDALGRFGPIGRDDTSAAAAAWRTGRLTVAAGDGSSHGGLVVPLAGQAACIGVLAIEIRHGREQDPAVQAVATVIAAQLATAVAGWPPASVSDPAQQPEARSA